MREINTNKEKNCKNKIEMKLMSMSREKRSKMKMEMKIMIRSLCPSNFKTCLPISTRVLST